MSSSTASNTSSPPLFHPRIHVVVTASMFAATPSALKTPTRCPTSCRRARGARVVAKDSASSLAPQPTHSRVQEVVSIAARKPPPPPPPPPKMSLSLTPVQAFGAGFVASAAIIKAHVKAKSGSVLRRNKPTLRYFDARGAAEVIRTIFAVAEVDYVDRRYTFSMDGGKPQVEEQHAIDKDEGMFDANLKRLPILEVKGERLGQSPAIARYIAEDLGMMGKGSIERAKIDAYCEHIKDMSTAYGKVRGNPFAPSTPEIEAAKATWYDETMKTWMAKLEIVTGEGGYAVGKKVSLADVVLYVTLTQSFDDGEKAQAAYADCAKINAIVDRIGNNTGVKRWLATRPDNRF